MNLQNNTINDFNALMDQAANAIMCGPDCQREKKSNQLKSTYVNAKTNLQTAPNQVQQAAKNYYTFTKGEAGYNEILETQLYKKADKITQEYQQSFDNDVAEITTEINTYDGLLINFMNVFDLYTKYKLENVKLEKEVKDTTSDIVTNDRKTFYEEQGIESLQFYYKIIRILYIILAISLVLSLLLLPSQLKRSSKLLIVVGVVLYPFISTKLLAFVIQLYYGIINMLPKNMYRNV
jgi:hypothetical protein